MKITLDRNDKTVAALRLMVDDDMVKAIQARQAFAAFIAPIFEKVVAVEAVINSLFRPWQFTEGQPSTIPLDTLFDVHDADLIKIWSAARPGSLATSQMFDVAEHYVATRTLESAVSFQQTYVRNARLDVVAAYLQRLAQEFLVKEEAEAFAVLSAPAAQAQYLDKQFGANTGKYQVIRSATQGTIVPEDFIRMQTVMTRANGAWNGGTPAAGRSITDILLSPEAIEQIRLWAFEAINTAATPSIPGTDKFRDDIYAAGGSPNLMGINLIQLLEMGKGYPYNVVFSGYAGALTYEGYGKTTAVAFSPGSEEVVIGVDRSRGFLARVVQVNPDTGSELVLKADNQWTDRSEKVGFYCRKQEGRAALGGRGVVSLVF
jgi:hypothetical protein